MVDDEKKIVELLTLYLQRDGYRIFSALDGRTALDVARRDRPDLVILDLNLPDLDGLEVFKQIRQGSNLPVIMLTARSEDVDRVLGLEMGADDYVTKPFSPREVMARVKAVLRRARGEPTQPAELVFGDLSIDLERHEVRQSGKLLELTPAEFRILQVMAQEPGRVFTRLQLLDKAWGDAYEGYDRTIDTHIKNLRRKIENDPQDPSYILTVYGIGYKFRGNVNA